jgi:SAM-dependent methyltransferase
VKTESQKEGIRPSPITPDNLPAGWREHARAQHLALIARTVGAPAGLWLKTDLYEELQNNRELIPRLPSANWVGMDLSAEVAGASDDPRFMRVVGDVRRLPFRDGVFDGVLSTSTLDHFDEEADLRKAFDEIRRVIGPGGRLVLTLDNPDNPLIRLRNLLPARVAAGTGLVPYPVGVTMNRARGTEALRSAGFVVDHVEFLLHVPHILGTRLASFGWYRRHALGTFELLAKTPYARLTGHFVAFICSVPSDGGGDT